MVNSQKRNTRSLPNARGYVVAVVGTVAAIGGARFAMGDAASETLSLFLAISVVATALIAGRARPCSQLSWPHRLAPFRSVSSPRNSGLRNRRACRLSRAYCLACLAIRQKSRHAVGTEGSTGRPRGAAWVDPRHRARCHHRQRRERDHHFVQLRSVRQFGIRKTKRSVKT